MLLLCLENFKSIPGSESVDGPSLTRVASLGSLHPAPGIFALQPGKPRPESRAVGELGVDQNSPRTWPRLQLCLAVGSSKEEGGRGDTEVKGSETVNKPPGLTFPIWGVGESRLLGKSIFRAREHTGTRSRLLKPGNLGGAALRVGAVKGIPSGKESVRVSPLHGPPPPQFCSFSLPPPQGCQLPPPLPAF